MLLTLSLAACGRTEADPAPALAEPVAAESAPETSGSPAEASSEVAENAAESAPEGYTVAIRDIRKHGNVILDTDFDAMNAHGMEIGDIITATVGEKSFSLPIGTAHSDVDTGSMLCRFDIEDNEVSLAINMGSFASEAGIGEKVSIEEEPGYRWDVAIGEVTLSLKEKQGYRAEYDARNLTRRTNARTIPLSRTRSSRTSARSRRRGSGRIGSIAAARRSSRRSAGTNTRWRRWKRPGSAR